MTTRRSDSDADDAAGAFEFEVAISYISVDEQVANDLATNLEAALPGKVYYAPERWKETAWQEGDVELSSIYSSRSRMVIVLFRPPDPDGAGGWGSSPWTRREQEAIQDRVHLEGFDFLIVIRTAAGEPRAPRWYSERRFVVDLTRHDMERAIGAILDRLASIGGNVRPLTAAEALRRRHEREEAEIARASAALSGRRAQGRPLAEATFEALERIVEAAGVLPADFERHPHRDAPRAAVNFGHYSLLVAFEQVLAPDEKGQRLRVSVFDQPTRFAGPPRRGARELLHAEFFVDIDLFSTWGWRDDEDGRFLPPKAFAEWSVKKLVELVDA